MTTKPEISVICANFNHAQYIEQAVTSIMHQTFSDLEILIVDDGSTDNSKEVIESICKLDDRIRAPIYLSQNKGKWFALNTAIAQAQGKLICLNDMDDASHRTRLRRQHDVMQHMGSFMVLTGFEHCYSDKDMAQALLWDEKQHIGFDIIDHQEVTKQVLIGFKTPGVNHFYVGNDYEAHGASGLWYRSLWERGMKFMPGNMGLRCQYAEDSDFNTKMTLLLQKTCVLKEPLYAYRRGTSTNPAFRESL